MLKVFSPAEARSAAEERQSKDATRARSIATLTDDLIREKNEVEAAFEATLRQQKEEAEHWFEENLARKKALEEEVGKLELRRKEALSPLLIKEEDIHSVQEALKARELSVEAKEEKVDDEVRGLMRRLDEMGDRELKLKDREQRVQRMEQGAQTQHTQVAQDAKRLSLKMLEFEQKVSERETDLAYRQSELDARTNLYAEKDKLFVERENEIQAAMRLLADQRVLLDKGFAELRNLQNKHDNRRSTA